MGTRKPPDTPADNLRDRYEELKQALNEHNYRYYILDDPAISIMLLGPDDHLIGEILLGDEDEEYGHYSVISTDLPMIYAVTSDYVEDVHLDILDVQE